MLMKKCYVMHRSKTCQIPYPHRRLRPMSLLLDLATLTAVYALLCRLRGAALGHKHETAPAYVTMTSLWPTRSVLYQPVLR